MSRKDILRCPAGRDIFKEKSKSEIVMLAPISKAESSRCAGCGAGMSIQNIF